MDGEACQKVINQPELLTLIIGHLRGKGTLADIGHSLCVSKLWHAVGLEYLYSNVVLDRISAFHFFKHKETELHWHLIRTLSVTFKRGTCSELAAKEIPEESFTIAEASERQIPIGRRERTNESVSKLAKAVRLMPRLRSFSIRRHAAGAKIQEEGFMFSQTMLKNIVEGLPETCVHVEIDTAGEDHGDFDEAISFAVAISNLLVRLHSVRLILSSAMVDSYLSIFRSRHGRNPLVAPNLKTLVISYFATSEWNDETQYAMIARFLEAFADTNPQLEKAYLVSLMSRPASPDLLRTGIGWFQYVDVFYVHDIKSKTLLAYPSMPVSRSSALLRISRETDLICSNGSLWEVAEDRVWHSSLQGDRLPASIDEMEMRLCKAELLSFNRIKTTTKGHSYDRKEVSCTLWDYEIRAGKRLIEPALRKDHSRPYTYWDLPAIIANPFEWRQETVIFNQNENET